MAAGPVRAGMQCLDVCSGTAGSRSASRFRAERCVARGRALSCGPRPRPACRGFERRPRGKLLPRAASAHPRAWRLASKRDWALDGAAEQPEGETTDVGKVKECAVGVIGNVLEAAMFEEKDQMEYEAMSDLDLSDVDTDMGLESLRFGDMSSEKVERDSMSECQTPSEYIDDYEEVLSLASDDAFDEACHGERAMLYVQAAMRVARGATEWALEDEGCEAEHERTPEEDENGKQTDGMSTGMSTEHEMYVEVGMDDELHDELDDDSSTVAPSDDGVQEVFQASIVEDVAFDCVSSLLHDGILGAMECCAAQPALVLTRSNICAIAPDVEAEQPDIFDMDIVAHAPEAESTQLELLSPIHSPGDAPDPVLQYLPTASVSCMGNELEDARSEAMSDTGSTLERDEVVRAPPIKLKSLATLDAEENAAQQQHLQAAGHKCPRVEVSPLAVRDPEAGALAPEVGLPSKPSHGEWLAILADLQREAVATQPVPARQQVDIGAANHSHHIKPTSPKSGVSRSGKANVAEPFLAPSLDSRQPLSNPGKSTKDFDRPSARPDQTGWAAGKRKDLPAGSEANAQLLQPSNSQAQPPECSSTMGSSKSKRRIIGGVVRAPVEAEKKVATSASFLKKSALPGPQKALATMFRIDSNSNINNAADLTASSQTRESSLTKGYDALGAEFHNLDEEDGRRGSARQALRGQQPLGAARLRGPLGAASALVLDLGDGATSSTLGRMEQMQRWSGTGNADSLDRCPPGNLRVTKAFAYNDQMPTSSGSLAWSMRMARSAAKRNELRVAY